MFFGRATAHKEGHAQDNETDINVLAQGIAFAHGGAHEHDGDGFARFGQYLDGVNDVSVIYIAARMCER